MESNSPKSGKRQNLFVIAYKNFPRGILETTTGVAFLSAHILYSFIRESGVDSVVLAVIISGIIIALVPLSLLYFFTLLRSGKIRRKIETEAEHQLEILYDDLEALHIKEDKDEKEVIRLEEVVQGNLKAREIKAEKENERWNLLTESLRLQNENRELASEERLLVAQQVKDIKDEGEIIRKGLVSDDLEARHVKDLKEDKRWDLLNERLSVSEEAGQHNIDQREEREIARQELASEERLLVAQQVKDVKEEREVARIGLALDDLRAREVKDRKEDDRWNLLNESIRLQKETVEMASQERILVAQQVKDIKDEGEIMRKGLVSDDLEARHTKEDKDEKRWSALYERLRLQEERSDEREKRQLIHEQEHKRMHEEDDLKDRYQILFARFIRNSTGNRLDKEVADGLAPLPEAWLIKQPEILKNPSLLPLLIQINERYQ